MSDLRPTEIARGIWYPLLDARDFYRYAQDGRPSADTFLEEARKALQRAQSAGATESHVAAVGLPPAEEWA